MIDVDKLRQALGAVQPEEVEELLDRLEAAESDGLEQARLNGMGGEREAALLSKLEAAEKERDWHAERCEDTMNECAALRAKIEEMERQEPYSYLYEFSNPIDGRPVWRNVPGYWNAQFPKSSKPLYALPGAQPAPSVPDGWRLVPTNATLEMREAGLENWQYGDKSTSSVKSSPQCLFVAGVCAPCCPILYPL